ncbi:hypothetical protein [Microvirga antarctica]|uniref:hypothetical protein n=1 Tax=Microvirga antarctica TaxID=2819233 RepID=UPI001B3141F5|nr:hypothetical protein [Microvirga antarctica]
MGTLAAKPDILFVDIGAGATDATTTISYEKNLDDELWERFSSGSTVGAWALIDPQFRTGLGDEADRAASYPITLTPGQKYEVGLFTQQQRPGTGKEFRTLILTVYCLFLKPRAAALITDENRAFGGTWYAHQVATNRPTEIVMIGASRKAPLIDADGLPHPVEPDGAPTAPLGLSTNHVVEIKPLLPGNGYFAVTMVTDRFGNWDLRQWDLVTLRRQLTVVFPTIHIYNDGDPFSEGEGEFWFRIYTGAFNNPVLVRPDFHLPTQDIDDWNETDRPYTVGFAHVGPLTAVSPEEAEVSVQSWGVEHDGVLEADEGAQGDRTLPLPTGRLSENVPVLVGFTMDCPVSTTDDDFHYGVDVQWSVTYAP